MIRIHPLFMQMQTLEHGSRLVLPLMAAVIRLDQQLIMVDTGMAGKSTLIDQLRLLRLNAEDFDLVINTHVHPDHVGNNLQFKKARIVVSRVDYEFAKDYARAMIVSDDPFQTLLSFYPHFSKRLAPKYAPYAKTLSQRHWRDDIIGHEAQIHWIEDEPPLPARIRLWDTPGHTPGHYSVEVAGDSKRMLIAADAMPSRLFWKTKLQELAPRYDDQLFLQSKKRIESFDGIIMGGHDKPFHAESGMYLESDSIDL